MTFQDLMKQEGDWIARLFGFDLASYGDTKLNGRVDLIDPSPDEGDGVLAECSVKLKQVRIGGESVTIGLLTCDDVQAVFDPGIPGAFSALYIAAYEGKIGQRNKPLKCG